MVTEKRPSSRLSFRGFLGEEELPFLFGLLLLALIFSDYWLNGFKS